MPPVCAVAAFSFGLAAASVAHASDTWQGRRYAERPVSNGIACNPTGLVLDRNGSKLRGRLMYNGAALSGDIDGRGKLAMTGSNGRWFYRFEGTATDAVMKGTWREERSGCAGTWDARLR